MRFNGTQDHFKLRIRISSRGGVIEDGTLKTGSYQQSVMNEKDKSREGHI